MTERESEIVDTGQPGQEAQPAPGALLRQWREQAGLSHAAVGEALHLTIHYVKALENDEYGKLPGLTFVKGYLRSYARYLGGDVDAVLQGFESHVASMAEAGSRSAELRRSRRRQDQALRWAVVAALIIVAGIAGGWWYRQGPETGTAVDQIVQAPAPTAVPGAQTVVEEEPPAAALRAPVNPVVVQAAELASAGVNDPAGAGEAPLALAADMPEAVGATTAADEPVPGPAVEDSLGVSAMADGSRRMTLLGDGEDMLEMRFSGSSWVEVEDAGRNRLFNDMLYAGDELLIQGTAPFQVLLGDAWQATIQLNTAAVDIEPQIRGDRTARLLLEPAAVDEAAGDRSAAATSGQDGNTAASEEASGVVR